MLALQQTSGNAAASRVLLRQPTPGGSSTVTLPPVTVTGQPPAPPGVIVVPPVVISNDPAKEAELQRKVDDTLRRFPDVWRGFCQDWFAATTAALASAPDPPNPYEAANFYAALAGNLAWAAISIVPTGRAVGAVIGLSVLGAGAGSGVFADRRPPSGRGRVTSVLAEERDRLEQKMPRSAFNEIVADFLQSDELNATEEMDQQLWRRFAPDIPFETKTSVMTANATAQIARWLEQFQAQYLEWKAREDVIAKARSYAADEAVSGPFGSPFVVLGELLGVGTPADRFFDQAMSDIPLTLMLTG